MVLMEDDVSFMVILVNEVLSSIRVSDGSRSSWNCANIIVGLMIFPQFLGIGRISVEFAIFYTFYGR